MKKIFLIFCLLLNFSVFAYDNNYSVSTTLQNNQKTVFENNENNIQNALRNIQFNNDDYIKITGKITKDGRLSNFKVEQSNIDDIKTNLILDKLKLVSNIYSPNFDEFKLYLFSKPKYQNDSEAIVSFDLTNEEKEAVLLANKRKIKNYYQDIYYNRSYIKWIGLVQKYKINKQVSLKIKIDKNGNLLSSKIIKSSNNVVFDNEIQNIVKNASPFSKISIENVDVLDIVLDFNKQSLISNKIASNFDDTFPYGFDGIARVILNYKGNITAAEIVSSSKNEEIDKQIIASLNKTKNFFETIKFDDKMPFVKYITFRQRIIGNAPVLQINYFSLGDDINPKEQEIVAYINKLDYLVKRNWTPFESKRNYSITAMFVVSKNGKVQNSIITKSSDIKEADDSVLSAINSAILPDIPDDLNNNFIPVEMTFDFGINPEINPILKDLYYSKYNKK